jgi:hypothetical protein
MNQNLTPGEEGHRGHRGHRLRDHRFGTASSSTLLPPLGSGGLGTGGWYCGRDSIQNGVSAGQAVVARLQSGG